MRDYLWIIDIDWLASIFYFGSGVLNGVENTITRIQNEFQPKSIVGALDSRPSFRHLLLEEYKGDRPQKDESYKNQFRDMVANCSIPLLQVDTYEADDLIASYVTQMADRGEVCVMVSGDKDLRQCLRKRSIGQYLKRTGKQWQFYSIDDAEYDWHVKQEFFIDYQTLVGDGCDKIPGCRGIGPKTAVALINNYGSIDSIMKHLDDEFMTKAISNRLLHKAFDVELNRQLVTLVTDIVLPSVTMETFANETGFD